MLPTKDVEAAEQLSDYKLLIHSLSGIGKTCFGRSIPDTIHLDTERGTLAHTGRIVRLRNWDEFSTTVNDLLTAKHSYKAVVIDTLDGLYNLAWNHILKTLSITHPAEAAHGKGWERITSTLFDQLNRLQLSGLGIICTAHTNTNLVKIKGIEITSFQPSMVGGSPRSAYQRTIDFFDIIGFLRMESMMKGVKDIRQVATGTLVEEETRVLDFSPSQFWVTKDRSGRLKKPIILPEDWHEDWTFLNAAWNEKEEVAEAINE